MTSKNSNLPPATCHLPLFLDVAHQLADAAADVVRPYFRQQMDVEIKSDLSPVTVADRAAEEAMRTLIDQHFPDHGILGEEEESFGTENEYVWVLDPIDGTRSFIAGKPQFGTLIALCHHGEPIFGIMNQPITNERWVGVKGEPTTFNGKPVKTRACASVADAVISTTSPHYFPPGRKERFKALRKQCKDEQYGGDCYAYGLLAMGGLDLVVEADLKPYDIIPLRPIIEGAGGFITGWHGKPITLTNFEAAIAAGDARTHAEALKTLGA